VNRRAKATSHMVNKPYVRARTQAGMMRVHSGTVGTWDLYIDAPAEQLLDRVHV
jgi:hypothetical protein